MKIDLTNKEIELLLEWYSCLCGEGFNKKPDILLAKKLMESYLLEDTNNEN